MASRKPTSTASSTSKADKKRTEILKAAGRCFRRTGFHQTSMQEICAEIGLGPGAVYRYFDSKDAIILAMAEMERTLARTILADLQGASSLPDALAEVVHAFAERYATASDTGLMAEVYAEGLRNKRVGTAIRKTEAAWVAGLSELIRAAQAGAQIDTELDARHTALLLTAMWDGMVIRQAYCSKEDDIAALLGFFEASVRRLLGRNTAGKRTKPSSPPTKPAAAEEKERVIELDVRQMSLI